MSWEWRIPCLPFYILHVEGAMKWHCSSYPTELTRILYKKRPLNLYLLFYNQYSAESSWMEFFKFSFILFELHVFAYYLFHLIAILHLVFFLNIIFLILAEGFVNWVKSDTCLDNIAKILQNSEGLILENSWKSRKSIKTPSCLVKFHKTSGFLQET
jgi:hypothetical protein